MGHSKLADRQRQSSNEGPLAVAQLSAPQIDFSIVPLFNAIFQPVQPEVMALSKVEVVYVRDFLGFSGSNRFKCRPADSEAAFSTSRVTGGDRDACPGWVS
jgi:hypothetical protein